MRPGAFVAEATARIKTARRLVGTVDLQQGKVASAAADSIDGGEHQLVADAAATEIRVNADVGDEPGVGALLAAGKERDVADQASLRDPDVAVAHALHNVAHAGQRAEAAAAQQTHLAHSLASGLVHAGAEDQLDQVGQLAQVAAQVHRAQSLEVLATVRCNRGHADLHTGASRPV